MEFLVERWNAQISGGTPVAKAVLWAFPDAEERKRGERTGLETLVVRLTDLLSHNLVSVSYTHLTLPTKRIV